MIYVLKTQGKSDGRADFVTLLVFDSIGEANVYILDKQQLYSDGHKYWVNFEIVLPGEEIETIPD